MERRDIRADMLAAHARRRELLNRKKPTTAESTHLESASDDLTCEQCGFEAKSKAGLGAHARSHADD